MATSFTLEIYTFRIRRRGLPDWISTFKTLAHNGDISQFIKDFIKFNDSLKIDQRRQKSFQFKNNTLKADLDKGIFSGIIESGDYGTESTLKHVETHEYVYTKKKYHLDIKPFFYLIFIPKDTNVSFIILQRTGVYGIKSLFTSILKDFIVSKQPSLVVEFSPFLSKDLAKIYLTNGAVKEISLRRFDLPTDVIEHLGLTEHNEEILSVEIKIASKKNGLFLGDRMRKFINSKNGKFFQIDGLEALGMDGDHKEKIKVKMGQNTRTIDLSEDLEIRPYFDISDEVEKDKETGHPVFESINELANRYIEDINKEIF